MAKYLVLYPVFAKNNGVHNEPIFHVAGVAPFPGATTGTGGRIRDVQATGRGASPIAATAGYSFGNLNIPGMQYMLS